jgi:hypothetical protein
MKLYRSAQPLGKGIFVQIARELLATPRSGPNPENDLAPITRYERPDRSEKRLAVERQGASTIGANGTSRQLSHRGVTSEIGG